MRLAVLWLLIVCACDDASDRTADGGIYVVTFQDGAPLVDPFGDASLAVRTRALLASCRGGPESGCHADSAAGFTATLDPDGGDVIDVSATEMPSLFRVEPYHPERSYLFWKVSNDPRIDGGVMPKSTGFDPRIPELIGPWIEAGAP